MATEHLTELSRSLSDLAAFIAEEQASVIESTQLLHEELTIALSPTALVEFVRFLRDDPQCGFISIIDVCGVDYPERANRFDVIYHLLSPRQNLRIRLKVQTDERTPVPSITEVFPGADWFEREAYDLYGILFSSHPDLRRLLTDYGFDGHPLRKDFPVTGFVEVRYDDEQKRVVYDKVKLPQEFRSFDFLSPWEGTDYVLPGDEKADK
jgi:NADH-quinone oxidoreductase subunit C